MNVNINGKFMVPVIFSILVVYILERHYLGGTKENKELCTTGSECKSGLCTVPDLMSSLKRCKAQPPICFTGSSLVTLKNGGRKKMSDVQLGDSVLTVDNNNHLAFSPIILNLHRSPNERGRFIVLRTNTEQSITLSPQHLIYSKNKRKEKDQT